MAMGHNLWRSHFGVDEHPFATYFDVHQGYRVSREEKTHTHTQNRRLEHCRQVDVQDWTTHMADLQGIMSRLG